MVQEETRGNPAQEPKKGVVKRVVVWLGGFLTGKNRGRNADCAGKAKTAQEIRDQWRNRCPWWGP